MVNFQLFGIQSTKIIEFGDNLFEILLESMQKQSLKFEENDVLIVTSKIVSMQERCTLLLSDVIPSEMAEYYGKSANMDPRVVEIILQEPSTEVVGFVNKALFTVTPYGVIPNAGVDQSNSPMGYVILLPKNPDQFASDLHRKLKQKLGRSIGIILVDSTVNPLRQGTASIALAIAGIEPIIDDRGKNDLFGYKMALTTRAIADNIATAANLVMGETDERTPFALLRGLKLPKTDRSEVVKLIPEDHCLIFGPLRKIQAKLEELM